MLSKPALCFRNYLTLSSVFKNIKEEPITIRNLQVSHLIPANLTYTKASSIESVKFVESDEVIPWRNRLSIFVPSETTLKTNRWSMFVPNTNVDPAEATPMKNRWSLFSPTFLTSAEATSSTNRRSLFDPAHNVESVVTSTPTTNRWSMFVPALLTHVSLGAPYGWSAISSTLSREHGFVVSAASDWSLELVTYSMAIWGVAGISSALVGKWQQKVGSRKSMAIGGIFFGSGFVLCGCGVMNHNLPLLYIGNMMWGLAYGCAYTPPIHNLLKWFPDRKGLASGIVIGGFGSGALFFTPAIRTLCLKFSTLPTYLGCSLDVVVENGRQLTLIGGHLKEVVYATSSDLAKLPYDGLAEGFYLVGSGNTGVASSLVTVGLIYGANIIIASLMIKKPPMDFMSSSGPTTKVSIEGNVNVDNALKTPQFWQLWSTAALLTTGGMGLMSVATPMLQNVFTSAMPFVVTPAFAFSYLMAMSAGNLSGRIFWASLSDKMGRWNTFQAMTLVAIPLFAATPIFITKCIADPSGPMAKFYLAGFCATTIAAVSVLGGVYAVLPAYEADLYGCKYVGAIHGRLLTFSVCATVLGPTLLLNLRKMAEKDAFKDMLSKVDPELFVSNFGVSLAEAPSLIEDPDYLQTYDHHASRNSRSQPVPVQQHHVHHGWPGQHRVHNALHGQGCG